MVPRLSDRPASRRDHWAIGRPPGHSGSQVGRPLRVRVKGALLRPASRRVLPRLLPPIDGQVEQQIPPVLQRLCVEMSRAHRSIDFRQGARSNADPASGSVDHCDLVFQHQFLFSFSGLRPGPTLSSLRQSWLPASEPIFYSRDARVAPKAISYARRVVGIA